MELADIGSVERADCSECKGKRNCEVRGYYCDRRDDAGGAPVWSQTDWFLLQCRGCDHVFVKTVSIFSEDYEHGYEPDGSPTCDYEETIKHWPALPKRTRPSWMSDFGVNVFSSGKRLDEALLELYNAHDNDLRMLSAMGIRTAFDLAATQLGADPAGFFNEKLQSLLDSNHIGPADMDSLKTLVDAGSASAHRGWLPTAEDIDTMMDILERFIHHAFVLPDEQETLQAKIIKMRDSVPKMPKRLKKSVSGKTKS